MVAETLFWISFGLIVYIYLGYYALIWILSRFYPEPEYKEWTELPKISMIIGAYNEENVIEEKIKNCLALDYPSELFEIFIGSDGSTDKTNDILALADDSRINVSIFHGRHGKNWVLNQLVQKSSGEILVFTDANIIFDQKALRHLIAPFQQEMIGGVIGKLFLVASNDKHSYAPEQTYWSIESSLRTLETRIRTTFGLTGAIYAIRRPLFAELPSDVIVEDDTYIVNNVLKQGLYVVNSEDATAHEKIEENIFNEMKRRIRICARNLNGIRYYKNLLNPHHGYIALGLWSHKVLRWFAPFPLIVLFISTLFIVPNPFYLWVLLFELAVLGCALLGILLNILKIKITFLTYCAYFFVINLGLLLGFFKFLFRLQKPYWETKRCP